MEKKTKAKIALWIIAVALAAGLFCLVFFLKQNFTPIGLQNAFLIPSIVMLCFVGLMFLAHFGTFDLAYYGFRSFFIHMVPHSRDQKYGDYVGYLEAKRQQRQLGLPYIWPFLFLGIALFLAFLIDAILCYTVFGYVF